AILLVFALGQSLGSSYALALSPEAPNSFALESFGDENACEDERKTREDERKEREDELYDEGTSALDEGAWERAVSNFRQVSEMKGRRADAGFYWMAYAKGKQGQSAEALATIQDLRRSYPQSRWLKEAGALEVEI